MAHMPTYFTHPSYLFRYPHRLMRTSLAGSRTHSSTRAHTHTCVCMSTVIPQ